MSESLLNFILGVATAFILMGFASYVDKIKWKCVDDKEDTKIEDVDRFEVIDDTGRAYVKGPMYGSPVDVELSYQDNGKTLKVFIDDKINIKDKT